METYHKHSKSSPTVFTSFLVAHFVSFLNTIPYLHYFIFTLKIGFCKYSFLFMRFKKCINSSINTKVCSWKSPITRLKNTVIALRTVLYMLICLSNSFKLNKSKFDVLKRNPLLSIFKSNFLLKNKRMVF